ncbi:MAG: hypothetical protein JWQ40_1771 [Segetibacter sp.]|nr:hypothetical protein [Segetibacter sp.]
MKRIIVLIPVAAMLSYCGSTKSTQTSSTESASKRLNVARSNDSSEPAGPIRISGAQYIPIYGRNEAGVLPQLEGKWILQSIGGTAIPGTSSINIAPKTALQGERRDSITSTQTINGVTRTTTEVNIELPGKEEKRITPQQGTNFHIPEKPSINFYGSNETFAGFTGCNKYSGRYVISGTNSISLQNATASTKMVCIGDYDEAAFLNTLRRVNSFKGTNDQLQLMEGDSVLLVFSKSRPQ